jgi:uncharacterized damage-inducible protein DinB
VVEWSGLGWSRAATRRAPANPDAGGIVFADAVRALYRYNRWATEQVLDAAGGLTSEQLLTPGTAGHGSVRDTLVHMIRAHRGWLSWWDGSLSGQDAYNLKLDPADFPTVAAVRAEWDALASQTEAFVERLDDDDLARIYRQTLPDGQETALVLSTMMLHVANHNTQHRSEVAAMLTGFGHSPGNLDFIYYVFSHP